MSKIILLVLLLGGITFWWHWTNTPDPAERKQMLQKTILGAVVVLCLMLVVTGRMNWLSAVIVGLLATARQMLPHIIRYFPVLSQLYRKFTSRTSAGNTSTVRTRYLEMTLDHRSGKLSGKILAGEFRNQPLDRLDRRQLAALYEFFRANDMDSARLLENYLAERFDDGSEYSTGAGGDGHTLKDNGMSVAEALQVLGLDNNPSGDEITSAYRKIMQQLHPDRGGNQYFAAKANQARKVLLNKFG